MLGIPASSGSEDCSASFIGTESISKSTDGQDMHIEDPYVEIIGTVKDDLSVKALTSVNMGKDLSRWFSASLLPSASGGVRLIAGVSSPHRGASQLTA